MISSLLNITTTLINKLINEYTVAMIAGQIGIATAKMMEPMVDTFSKLSEVFSEDLIKVDTDAFAKAFNFNMNEEELSRLMETMLSKTDEKSLLFSEISTQKVKMAIFIVRCARADIRRRAVAYFPRIEGKRQRITESK